jgi:hypothetical protein
VGSSSTLVGAGGGCHHRSIMPNRQKIHSLFGKVKHHHQRKTYLQGTSSSTNRHLPAVLSLPDAITLRTWKLWTTPPSSSLLHYAQSFQTSKLLTIFEMAQDSCLQLTHQAPSLALRLTSMQNKLIFHTSSTENMVIARQGSMLFLIQETRSTIVLFTYRAYKANIT